ncbi:23S rRNA (pseudouridine(1915)-N(3))-methyltransferase RlmH [Thalassobaculum sp.]|uniref:23S rRNA (pseudouridine(1915)-N(3))-methyltransferase RlmH n=1 Tax=Thalassobaculum sp. TaxID=2022740 RepID=UPI0032ED2A62
MRVTLVAVGRARRGPKQEQCRDYAGRLPWTVEIIEVEPKKRLGGDALKAHEAELLAARIPDGAVLVALDERGRALSSSDFAAAFRRWQDDGRQAVCFLIGGADGLDPGLRDRADMVLAFGPQTWPHMMVRAMLLEQVYRAERILAGHPYHRE